MRKTKFRQSLLTAGCGFLSLLLIVAISAGAALAQSATGEIVGKVTDPNGDVVSGASVSVKSSKRRSGAR